MSVDPHFNMSGASLNPSYQRNTRPSTSTVKRDLFTNGAYNDPMMGMQQQMNTPNMPQSNTKPMMNSFNQNGAGNRVFMYDVPEWVCSVLCADLDVDDILETRMGDGLDDVEVPKQSSGEGEAPASGEGGQTTSPAALKAS